MDKRHVSLDVLSDEPAAKDNAYGSADKIDLQRAISHLPLRTRAAVVLFELEGYSHAEVSSIMNIREGTSKALVHRGRKLLRRELTV